MSPESSAVVFAGLLAVALGVGIVGVGHSQAGLEADVVVTNSTCIGEEIGIITVDVTYHGDKPIAVVPHTWDEHRHVQYTWLPRSITLEPGKQTLRLWAPVDQGRISPNSTSQLYLNHGQRRAITNWRSTACP